MNGKMHTLIAIASSMRVTFLLDCALLQTTAYNSFIQQYFHDVIRDFNLIMRCGYDGRHSKNLKYTIFYY